MFYYSGISTFFQINFPASVTGFSEELEYSIYRLGETGEPVLIEGPTNLGVIEIGRGAYGVSKTFETGEYSIVWEIPGTPYSGSEAINIYDNIYDVIEDEVIIYDGFGSGEDRFDSVTSDPIVLQFQFIKDRRYVEAYSVNKVEVYDDYDKALSGLSSDVIQTIASGSITHSSTGLYAYVVSALISPKVYFDKIFFTPEEGGEEVSFIGPFYVGSEELDGIAPGSKEVCKIILNIVDITGGAWQCKSVNVNLCQAYAKYGKALVVRNSYTFYVQDDGLVKTEDGEDFELIETTTMTADTGEDVYYHLTTLDGEFSYTFTIPKGTLQANLLDLPVYPPEETG
jgi:hypothetical protein